MNFEVGFSFSLKFDLLKRSCVVAHSRKPNLKAIRKIFSLTLNKRGFKHSPLFPDSKSNILPAEN